MADRPGARGAVGGGDGGAGFETRDLRRPYVKAAIVVLVLAFFAVLLRFTPLAELISNVAALQDAIDRTGYYAPVAFLGISAGLMFIGAPRLVFCTVGGALFGFIEGLALSQVATLLGALGPFLFARWGFGRPSERRNRLVAKAQEYLEHRSILDVFLIRQLPVWGALLNLALGSSDVPLKVFLIGSFIGYLPQSIVFSLVGSGFGEESTLHAVSRVFGAGSVLFLFFLVVFRVMRKKKGRSGRN